jgi:hypothetical protein
LTNLNEPIQWVVDMFKITEIKRWAKDWGYTVIKEKDDSINGASYYWCKNDDPSVTGVALSVSKLATAIFNDLSDSKWLSHQKTFQENKEDAKFSTSE